MSATTEGIASRRVPGLGLIEFEEEPYHRYWFTPEGGQRRRRQRSVTTILQNWPKPWLARWAAEQGANLEAAREEAFRRGRAVHRFVEHYLTTGELLDPVGFEPGYQPYLQAAAAFLFDLDPQPTEVEQLVCWPERNYAGRPDLIAQIEGASTLADFKTSPEGRVYPEAHVQVHAYELASDRCGGPAIERRLIIALADDGTFRAVEGADAEDVWQTCLAFDDWRTKFEKGLGNGR